MQPTRFTGYDPMAWLYATHWGSEYHEQGYSILERLLLNGLPRGARVLDLCCGDGRIALQLSRSGFEVTGIDGSERMLEFARQRVPDVPFIAADARDFTVNQSFDAVVSTFDALNHVMSPGELRQVFHCVRRALKPEGTFVFDLNREEAYTTLWATTSAIVQPDVVSVCTGGYDPNRRVAYGDFTLFRLLGTSWERSDFRMSQYCHMPEEVLAALQDAGFDDSKALDAASEAGMFGNIGKGRTYWVARSRNV